MPDPVSRKKHKKKVLERWENEGGMIPATHDKVLQGGSTAECSGTDVSPPRSGSPQSNDQVSRRSAARRRDRRSKH